MQASNPPPRPPATQLRPLHTHNEIEKASTAAVSSWTSSKDLLWENDVARDAFVKLVSHVTILNPGDEFCIHDPTRGGYLLARTGEDGQALGPSFIAQDSSAEDIPTDFSIGAGKDFQLHVESGEVSLVAQASLVPQSAIEALGQTLEDIMFHLRNGDECSTPQWRTSSMLNWPPRSRPVPLSLSDDEVMEQQLLHRQFEKRAHDHPERVAIDFLVDFETGPRIQYTYQQVSYAANSLSATLHHAASQSDAAVKTVAVLMDTSPELYVSYLASLKAGLAFCPIPIDAPEERKKAILADLKPVAILARGSGKQEIICDIISMSSLLEKSESHHQLPSPVISINEDDAAYILYTSGTTGMPKGVTVSHISAACTISAMSDHFGFSCQDGPSFDRPLRWFQGASPTFDISLFEIFWTLSTGSTLCCAPRSLIMHNIDQVVTALEAEITNVTPSVASLIDPSSLRAVMVGGEVLSTRLVQDFSRISNPVKDELRVPRGVYNGYGPTEVTIYSVAQARVPEGQRGSVIGTPLATCGALIINTHAKNLELVPMGTIGELVLTGPQVSKSGYLNRPEETAAAFVDDKKWGRVYKTGDRARIVWNDEGEPSIEFLGRISEDQVKLSGRRVELSEIENILQSRTQGIQQILASLWKPRSGVSGSEKVVCLLVVDPKSTLSFEDVRSSCFEAACKSLPEYMRPFKFIQIQSLPRSASGKVDRKAASEYVRSVLRQAENSKIEVLPADALENSDDVELENKLLHLLAEVIGDLSPAEALLTATTPLEEAGVDSLHAMRFLHSIRREWPDSKSMQPLIGSLLESKASIRSIFFTSKTHDTATENDSVDRDKWKAKIDDFATRNMTESLKQLCSVAKSDIAMLLPMTSTQNQLAMSFAKDERNYISHTLLSLKKDTSLEVLNKAVETVLDRHDIYRTAMVSCNDELSPFAQVVLKPESWHRWTANNPRVIRYQGKPNDDSQKWLDFAQQFLSFERQCLYLVQLVEADAGSEISHSTLVISVAHFLCDGASNQVLLNDIQREYSGLECPPSLEIQDVILDWISNTQIETDQEWQTLLKDWEAERFHGLSGQNVKQALPGVVDDYGHGMVEVVGDQQWQAFEARSRALGASPLSVLQASWSLLLHSLSEANTGDVVFGSVISGQYEAAHAPTFSVVPCRIALPERQTIKELLHNLSNNARFAQSHRDMSFGVFESLPYNTALALQSYGAADSSPPQAQDGTATALWHKIQLPAIRYDFDIFIEVFPIGLHANDFQIDPMSFKLTYRDNVLSSTSAEVILKQLAAFTEIILTSSADEFVQTLPARLPKYLLSSEGTIPVSAERPTENDYERERSVLHAQFENQAKATPDLLALSFYNSLDESPIELSYAELDARSNGLANILREENLAVIPICMRRCVELYVSILAILKAGSAWSPIDETLPIQRLTSLIARTEGKVILTTKDSFPLVEQCLSDESLTGVRVILVDSYSNHKTSIRAEPRQSIQELHPAIEGSDLAYLLWTSGTTGEPKGVMIQHFAAANAMRDLQVQVEHEEGVPVRTLQLSAYSFDVFVQDLFFTWGLAGSVISGTRELVLGTFTEFVRKSKPTHAHLTPSFGASIDVEELRGSTLKTVTFIGEKLTEDVAEAWAAPEITSRAYNTYGPAENAVVSTMRQFFGKSRDKAKAANVGFPLTPCTAYVVRDVASSNGSEIPQWELVPRYGVGELALGGAQVAHGYLKNEAKTTKAFIQGGPGIDERIYLTGDMVRLNDHGFEFLGRNDDLVKITGIRIELSEISAACATVKDDEGAVEHIETLYLPRPEGDGSDSNYKVVVTFVSVKEDTADLSNIRRLIFKRARDLLPTYMVPGHLVVLESTMPRTASNKVDRKALQSIYKSADLNTLSENGAMSMGQHAGKTQWSECQLSVLDIITKSFKVPTETLAPEDSLAGLGFSSLQVTKLAWTLRRQMNCNISVISLMQCQTLGELVDDVQKSLKKDQAPDPVNTAAHEESWVVPLKDKLTELLQSDRRPENTSYIMPATPFQESLLVETMIDRGAYWSHRIFDLNHLGQVDSSRLRAAWCIAAAKIDILRTVFFSLSEFSVQGEGIATTAKWLSEQGISATMLQLVLEDSQPCWINLQNADADSLAAVAERIQIDLAPLAAASPQPPWAISFSEGENRMMLSMHHALHDATSSRMLLEIVSKIYQDPDEAFDHRNNALQMSKGLELGLLPSSAQRDSALSAWNKHIHEIVISEGALNAPFPDLTGSRKQGKGIISAKTNIPEQLLQRAAGSPGLPQLLQSAFGCILAGILELKAVIFGQVISKRILHPGLEGVIGPAMATLPVAIRAHASSAQQLWADMDHVSRSLNHEAHSLHPVDIKKLLNSGSDEPNVPFAALFVYHPATDDHASHLDLGLEMFREIGQALSLNVEHPLALNVFEADNNIELSGNSAFVSQGILESLLHQILDQALAMLKFPQAPLNQLGNFMAEDLVSRVGEHEMLVGKEIGQNPADLITRWATERPSWTAAEEIFFEDDDGLDDRIFTQSVTYAQLEELVNSIAAKLTTHEVNLQPDDVVALYLRRDLKSLAAILAIFKCNFIYLPIEADLPATRKQFLVHDADAKLVISTQSLIEDLDLGPKEGPPSLLLPESHDELDLIRSWPSQLAPSGILPGDGGYLLYTSGSTGRPKGVRVSNANLLHFIAAMTERLTEANADTARLGGAGKYLNVASRAFDTHLTSMFAPWHLGFSSAISKDRNAIFANLKEVINEVGITHMGSVPSVFIQLGLRLEDIPSLRVLTIGGEKASHELFDQLNEGNQGTALMNFYGPTETTIGCFSHKVGDHSNARNLGLPLRGLEAMLLIPRDDNEPVVARKGQPGELCISGPQVSIGYMNRPEENAKSFQQVSFREEGERRIYKTGDIMRMMHDGTVEFLGRQDQQTKIRGQRFEIDEVVSFIKKNIAIQGPLDVAAAVVDQRLVAFLARKEKALLKAELESDPEVISRQSNAIQSLLISLEQACQEALPAFMVPEMAWVSKIPYLAASGKIDSKSIRNLAKEFLDCQETPETPSNAPTDPVPSLSSTEVEIIAALQEAIGKEVIATSGRSLQSLGIDSLSGVQLLSLLKKRGFSNLNLMDLISPSCTIGSLARMARRDVPFDQPSRSILPAKELNFENIRPSENRIDKTNVAAVLPCLPLQSSLVALSRNWLESNEQVTDVDVPYVTNFIYELAPGTDISRWKEVAENVISNEATLRTCFIQREEDGQVFQIVLNSPPSPFDGQDNATSLISEMSFRPPIRVRIQEDVSSGKNFVFLRMHHALYDGMAVATLRKRLEVAYANRHRNSSFENRSLANLKNLSQHCHLDETQVDAVRSLWQAKLDKMRPCIIDPEGSETSQGAMVRSTRRLALSTTELKEKLQHGNPVSMSTAFQLATVLSIASLTRTRSIIYGFTMSLRPFLANVVDEVDSFVGPCLNTIVHPIELASSSESLPQLASRIHENHHDICQGKIPLITAEKIQRWTSLDGRLFNSILTVNVVPDSHEFTGAPSSPGQMTALPGTSKTDLALAIDVDLHGDGQISLSLASAGILTRAQLDKIGTLFETILDSCASEDAMVEQFASVNHKPTGVGLSMESSPQKSDNYVPAALLCVQSAASSLLRLDTSTIAAKNPATTSLYHLGIDSINILPFVKAINKSEGIKITPHATLRARTIQGVAELTAQAKRERDTIQQKEVNGQMRSENPAAGKSSYDQILQQVAGEILFIATPLQEGMLTASMEIEGRAYSYTHTMQLSQLACSDDTPTFDRFFSAVRDTVQDCEILRTRFSFTQNEEAPWIGVVSTTDQSDLVKWHVSESGRVKLKIHHALYDARSIRTIWQLLNENYAKRLADHEYARNEHAVVKYPFRHFAKSSSLAQKSAVKFWVDSVQGYNYNPVDISNETLCADSVSFITLSESELSNLQDKCRTANVSLKVALQLAWAKVLAEDIYKQPDVVLGDVISASTEDSDLDVLGPTINTVPVRVDLASRRGTTSISEALNILQALSDTARGEHGMASLRAIQTHWRSTQANSVNTSAGLFQSLFVFDGVISSQPPHTNQDLIVPVQLLDGSDNKSPAYDDYPFIVSFRIQGGELKGKLRTKTSHCETQNLLERLASSLRYLSSEKLQNSVLSPAHLYLAQNLGIEAPEPSIEDPKTSSEVTGSTELATKADAILEIARKVIGGKIQKREITHDTKLVNIGLDSISAIRFSRALKKQLGIQTSVFEIIRGANAREIAGKPTSMESDKLKNVTLPPLPEGSVTKGFVAKKLNIAADQIVSIVPVLPGQLWTLRHWLRSEKRFFEAPWAYLVSDKSMTATTAASHWAELCRVHEILRTTFIDVSSSAVMQITLNQGVTVSKSFKSVQDSTITISELIQMHVREGNATGSDLTAPPASLSFLEGRDGKAIIFRAHHALYDAWNIQLIQNDLVGLFDGKPLPRYQSVQDSIQQIMNMRNPEAESDYWKQYLTKAQGTVVQSDFEVSKDPARPHFKIGCADLLSQDTSKALASIISSKSYTSAAIIIAYARSLGRLTGCSHPTFGFNHSSRSLESSGDEQTFDLTEMSIPTMTVTPLTVDTEDSKQQSFEAVQDHLAQLTRFSQAENLESMAPKLNSHLNIIYPDVKKLNLDEPECPHKLQRYKLGEPLASEYFTNAMPSSITSTVDSLDTSLMSEEQLYFNVLVFPDGRLDISVSGDKGLLRGDRDLAMKLARSFSDELSSLTQ